MPRSLVIQQRDHTTNLCLHRNCITDYFPRWRVPKTRTVSEWARWASLVIVGWGWYEFETNDVGLTEGVKRIWKA